MPVIKITKEVIDEFFQLQREEGLTQAQVADRLGFNLNSIRLAAQRLDYPWKASVPLLTKRINERRQEIESNLQSQAYWAQEFHCSQPRIAAIFKELDLPTTYSTRRTAGSVNRKVDQYRQIINYITANGGYVPHAIESLGFKTPPQEVRDFCRDIGFDLSLWQFAWQEYGSWLTLPGPWERRLPNNYVVPAVCRACGTTHQLNLQNARSGKSTSCQSCSSGKRNYTKVQNITTGETYSSVMAWTKSIGQFKNYQRLRTRIRNSPSVVVGEHEFKLI